MKVGPATEKDVIVLVTSDGKMTAVPMDGPLSTRKSRAIALGIQAIDERIDVWHLESEAKVNLEVVDAIERVVIDYRDEAISEFDLGLRTAQKTSGLLDDLLSAADEKLDKANQVLNERPPSSLDVTTHISSTKSEYDSLHYMGRGEYNTNSANWQTYTDGQLMRIGNYVFRLQSTREDVDPYKETFPIIADPTVRQLSPVRE